MRIGRFLSVVVLSLTACVVAPPQPAIAGGSTCPGLQNEDQNNFGYYNSASTSIFGDRANIEWANPDLCGDDTTGSGFSVAWDMVTASSSYMGYGSDSRADAWAQVGYGQFASHSEFPGLSHSSWYFSQFTKTCKLNVSCGSASQVVTSFWGTPDGASEDYVNAYYVSCGCIVMRANGHEVDRTTYNPMGLWASAWTAEFAEETNDPSTDAPGTSSDVVTMHTLYKCGSDNSGCSFISSVTPAPNFVSRYHQDTFKPDNSDYGTVGLHFWTSPLTYP